MLVSASYRVIIKCLFLSNMKVNWRALGYGLLIRQNKTQDVTFDSRKLQWPFFTICCNSIDQKVSHENKYQ